MNRNSAVVTPFASVVTGATNTLGAAPVLIPGRLLSGGTTNQTRIGGEIRSETEWELKPNTKYLFRVTNVSGGAITISAAMEGYTEK